MPKRAAPGSGKIADWFRMLGETTGWNATQGGALLGKNLSPSYIGKIFKRVKARKSLIDVIGTSGTKRAAKNVNRLSAEIDLSGLEVRERHINGKTSRSIIPPEPKGVKPKRGKIKSAKVVLQKYRTKKGWSKNADKKSVVIGDTKKTVYEYDPEKKIKIPKGADIQFIAMGKGYSKGKKITQVSSTIGDWVIGWSALQEQIRRTQFTVSKIHVVIFENAPLKTKKKKSKNKK
jgi:hypothetical protein